MFPEILSAAVQSRGRGATTLPVRRLTSRPRAVAREAAKVSFDAVVEAVRTTTDGRVQVTRVNFTSPGW